MRLLVMELRIVRANIRTFEQRGCLDDGLDVAKEKELAIMAAIKEIFG